VGGYPSKDKEQHPGGQLTASTLLVEYANENNIDLKVIDTSQCSFPIPSFFDRVKSAFQRIRKLISYLKNGNIAGVIIFSSTGFSFYEKTIMCAIASIYRVKSLLFVRSGHFIDMNNSNPFLKYLNKMLLKIPTFIGAQGLKWSDFYETMGVDKQKVKLIHNWIKINEYTQYNTTNDKVVFLFVGWIVEKKGVLDLFDVIEQNRDLDQYVFQFAGNGTLFEELQRRKKKNNLHNIKLLGWQSQEALNELYKKVDAFILPSHAEGFPNVILEALNHKLPIISTNVGGIEDSVIHEYNGYIIESKNKLQLYESIKKMAESETIRNTFSHNSIKILRNNHDYSKNCKEVFEIFNDK
jgi:glycosyltransferase involved in cell wall biosynthesis